jgi:hypothetical protein
MKNILKLAGLLVIALIVVLACTPKQSGTATQSQTPTASETTAVQVQPTKQTSSGDFEMNGTTLVKYNGNGGDVTIPNGVTHIGAEVFREKELTSIVIPNSVISIGGFAFYMNKLTSVYIPDSVTQIGMEAFAKNKLTRVIVTTSADFNDSAFDSNVTIVRDDFPGPGPNDNVFTGAQ